MTKSQEVAIRQLRKAGYAIIIWEPDELGDADVGSIENRSIALGWDIINDSNPDRDSRP